ncbi:helix-turn-helix domain-containing protein [Haloferax sp. MBLA0076]|uniref:Helix-turn-helix domain-containing protein n=1 Tax=Haloferax litoreum TaxID=2666140 RepID=A0A6A8GJS4_9EURY|nr:MULTISPECIES: helix-turn-helix domain-containing protein [Haloferax]KAB1190535.1 helix-turn-helix domain-containing protein [Haloferax sp. CBA1148]MRX23518.1 helix-turn-helix domain-containing protein [Haloferax litoreum]
MFEAEIHLQQHKRCILTDVASEFDASFEIAIEELHNHQVTFVIEFEETTEAIFEFMRDSSQVSHIERMSSNKYLVTKQSCGAYDAIDRNHGIIRRRSRISPERRVYSVLLFRREDLRAMIEEFKRIGNPTLGSIKQFEAPSSQLTTRQREVIQLALNHGYFDWPRKHTAEEVAQELNIDHSTFLEHIRKAQRKLLSKALSDERESTSLPQFTES